MITEITIKDNTKSPLMYLPEVSAMENGAVYKFSPGVNIIIGRNGCGKSTLLELIYAFGMTREGIVSEFPQSLLSISSVFWDMSGEFLGGVDIKADWDGVLFRYFPKAELLKKDSDTILGSMENFVSAISKGSTGESILDGLGMLFKKMFSPDTNLMFPVEKIRKKMEESGEFWKSRLRTLLDWYRRNHVKLGKEDFEFTVLLDEPDRNLDVHNLKEVYGILSTRKPQTQVIAVIHNPLLILKLSEIPEINFIEMTPGYLQEIKEFMNE